MVKRVGNLFEEFISMKNLLEAEKSAARGKRHRPDVRKFEKNLVENLEAIQTNLINGTYHTSDYRIFTINENGKEREVADLPFRDRVVHWALMNVVNKVMLKTLINHTYAALPRRGMHKAHADLMNCLRKKDAKYFLKIDIKKYFPSIDKQLMYDILARKIKDVRILELCRQIIDEYPLEGIPIGNYTSQYFANFYLSSIDHYMKEKFHCKYYFRYMDDIVIVGWSKPWLHRALKRLQRLTDGLRLTIKGNWCIRPVEEGIDFVGFVSFPTHSLIRKRTKNRIKKICKRAFQHLRKHGKLTEEDIGAINSYYGFIFFCDCKNLFKKIGLLKLYKYIHSEQLEVHSSKRLT